jgi:hypothetical protein
VPVTMEGHTERIVTITKMIYEDEMICRFGIVTSPRYDLVKK